MSTDAIAFGTVASMILGGVIMLYILVFALCLVAGRADRRIEDMAKEDHHEV
jgi:hypothetical protein